MPTHSLSETASTWRDLALVVVATGLFAFASVHFELGEALSAWTSSREQYQLDELPGVLLVLALGLAWFAWRRSAQARSEVERRCRAEQELTAALAENRKLARANTKIQESERRTLARELHDELGQYLNAVKVDATGLRNASAGLTADGASRVAAIVAIVDRLQATVRDILRRLRPPGLDELGLSAAIEDCVDGWQQRFPSVRYDLEMPRDLVHLGDDVNIAVYRIVQEALTNVAKHARASRVRVSLSPPATDSTSIELRISDNGNGARRAAPSNGVGLVGMRERVEALGGRFEAGNAEPSGFRIVAMIPIGAPR